MTDSRTITYPLFVFAGGANDDMGEIEVTFEGDIVPYRPATGPTYDSGGEPAEGGYAELTDAWMPQFTGPSPGKRLDMSWLLDVLPDATSKHISELIYDDWMQDDRRTT